ncbi:MAG: hypothetical protein EOP87_26155 [Verrucomicrobiaceae bacterium]|nr:MAG: hypothetical protein EOP87_26155 [Verrucomicrobiaceae bacterium]
MKNRLFRSSFIAACVVVTASLASHTQAASVALQDFSFSGGQETVQWEAGRLAAGPNVNIPSSGVGTISPQSPGYSASAGYYSWGGDYGLVTSTSIQNSSILTDIQNVVFQQVSMGTGVGSLNFKGGPVIQLFNGSTLLDISVPVTFSGLGPGVSGSAGGFDGTYAASIFQWDLSSISETVTAIRITSPIPNHSSTIEARIDIGGGGFAQVIPEPSAALLGALGTVILLRRRR